MLDDGYDLHTDGLGSYHDAIAALAARHRAIVNAMLPELRRRRYALHITVDTLATEIGVSPSLLGMWETARRIPAPDLFARWRMLLGC